MNKKGICITLSLQWVDFRIYRYFFEKNINKITLLLITKYLLLLSWIKMDSFIIYDLVINLTHFYVDARRNIEQVFHTNKKMFSLFWDWFFFGLISFLFHSFIYRSSSWVHDSGQKVVSSFFNSWMSRVVKIRRLWCKKLHTKLTTTLDSKHGRG